MNRRQISERLKNFRVRAFLKTLIAVPICFVSYYLTDYLVVQHYVHAQVTSSPFTVVTERYVVDGSGKESYQGRCTFALRSDGATAEVQPIGPQTGLSGREIVFPDGRRITVYPEVAAKSTWPRLSAKQLQERYERFNNMPDRCISAKRYFLKNDTIMGHPVVVLGVPFDDGTLVELWTSPDVPCQKLAYRYGTRLPDGSLRVQSDVRVVELKFGPPDQKLFDEGANYDELKPSEVQKRFLAKIGVPPDEHMGKEAEEMDKAYFAKSAD